MKAIQKIAALMLLSIFSVVAQIQAQVMKMPADHIMIMPNDIKWGPAPPGLPPGSKAAVIEGNPSVAGLFTIRAKIPANYKIMPHWHPADEHITVIKGSCYMGIGDKFNEKEAKKMTTGGLQ
ncbi:cupin domain-containing protein [Flavobacterium sp. AED]|uniref:cupin domain-containing protein n=1 Tax=Flavobacterium sp. AED TaxID=1423323 RepID=UPI0012E0566B|nr:cupin domain-containing protein [Flavobacterium sp. AED]